MPETEPLLVVDDLRTWFQTDAGPAKAVDGVSFSVSEGKTLALVGESGCGKTVTALSILKLIPQPPGEFVSGEIRLAGRNLLQLPARELREVRGGSIAMIFQEPGTSLNPVYTIGDQVAETIRQHRKLSRRDAAEEVVKSLKAVQVSDPERRVRQYPHELSGGMKQRVMIAMALSCNPRVLIADEPTTAVDVTIQARILELLLKIQQERGMAILLITHDLGVVAEVADDVAVMYAGQIVEKADVETLFGGPRHPYTVGLFNSLPDVRGAKKKLEVIEGSVPPATQFPPSCRFRDRCPMAIPACAAEIPLVTLEGGHQVRCIRQEEVAAAWLKRSP